MKRLEGFEFHLKHTPISYNYTDEDIERLLQDKADIKERVFHLENELQQANPNINIIMTYKQRHSEFVDREALLR